MIHIPAAEISQLLIKLSKNPSFLRVGRILMFALVVLSAIGLAGTWKEGLEPWMPGCTVPTWGCYSGPPLSVFEYVDQLGATRLLLVLPWINLFCALLLLFMPPRTYLLLLMASLFSFFLPSLGGDPSPYTNVATGDGGWLHLLSTLFLVLFSFSLAIAEQVGSVNKKRSWQEDWGLKD
jgi:hypothetical protein